MKVLLFLSILLFCLVSLSVSQKCCEGTCQAQGLEKYYSIAKSLGKVGQLNCGECCLSPDDYPLYLKFEPNLLPANASTTDAPCFFFNFTVYIDTEVHGQPPVQVTLDMYTGA